MTLRRVLVTSTLLLVPGLATAGGDALVGNTLPQPKPCGACVKDQDSDGIPDQNENLFGLDPLDRDSDDDGVLDGDEIDPLLDADGDGLVNALDPDSDDDGIHDGTELGADCLDPDTDASKGFCVPDGDLGLTTTDSLARDTDGDGLDDGEEDLDANGVVDPGETDPVLAVDPPQTDTDGDGLTDAMELAVGTDPTDADTDDDGVADGDEPNPRDDLDGDGLPSPLDADSDGDGVLDGTEVGADCAASDTDPTVCIPDADGGVTTTWILLADSDRGGALDGDEDANHDGAVGECERDPADPADDDEVICEPPPAGGAGGGAGEAGSAGGGAGGAPGGAGGSGAGGGCSMGAASANPPGWLLLSALALRRRRARR